MHSITNGLIGYLSLYALLNSLDRSIFVIEQFVQHCFLLKHVSLEYFPEEMNEGVCLKGILFYKRPKPKTNGKKYNQLLHMQIRFLLIPLTLETYQI